jgi:hypothetical protein
LSTEVPPLLASSILEGAIVAMVIDLPDVKIWKAFIKRIGK